MSNRSVANRVIAHIAGTQPNSTSLFGYFNASTPISYAESRPKLILVFKSNVYVELKAISIAPNQSNLRKYQIDLLDYDQTILQTIVVDQQQKQPIDELYAPIGALQITYLETTDGQAPKGIRLTVEGCFGLKSSPFLDESSTTTTTPRPPQFTTCKCHTVRLQSS